LLHAQALLTTESLSATNKYFESLWSAAAAKKTRSIKDIVSDFHIRAAYSSITKTLESGMEHPKLATAKSVVEKLLANKESAKILLFTEFRDNVPALIDTLSTISTASVHKFIGQASRTEKGMSQKTQAEVLQRFRSGELNVLVCTSVGEEGIDIPDVDLVIFYSPLPSVIRTVQRKGRTGRTSMGKVLMLVTKGTRDEAYYWSAKRAEEALNLAIRDMQANVKQETLEQYPMKTLDNITIFVDSRESDLAELLHSKGAKARGLCKTFCYN
jgi:Fanconi anemia group M protein